MTTTTMEPSQTLAGYIDRLRELIPARTLGLYVLAIGLVSSLAATPAEVATKFGWLLLVVVAGCAVINFIGRMVEHKGPADAAVSTVAFILLTLTQRFTGPFAALGLDTQATFVVASLLALGFVFVLPWFWSPPKP